jgi:two-component system, NtrC family, sensor kinase
MLKPGFRLKVYVGILSLLLLLGIAIFLMVSHIVSDALLEENHNRGISIGTNLAARMAEPILSMDFLRMKNLVDETVRLSDDIFYAFALDTHDTPLVHTFKGGFPVELRAANAVHVDQPHVIRLLDTGEELVYDFAFPILIGENQFGTIRIGLLRTRIQEAVRRLLWSISLLTGAVILIAGFAGAGFAQSVTRRIKLLHTSSEKALRGDLDVQTAPILKKNCWEFMHCGKQECPAHGKTNHRCWYIAGTLCPTCVEGEYAKKITTCRSCMVYRKCSGDEIQSLAESFDSMVLSLNRNLSDLRQAEKTLIEQRGLLRTILDATPDLVSLQDRDLMYRAANKAFCKILGREEQEIIGHTNSELFRKDLAETYQREDVRVLESGVPLVKENEIAHSGASKWIHVVKIPVYNSEDEITGLLCSCRDITEFKIVQEQLTQAQKMETVGQLTAGIAHEINTPLGIILGYAQLLLEETEAESQISADLATVEKQTQICRKIVADLLSFSRHTGTRMGGVDLNRAIKEVISMVAHTFNLDRVRIESSLDPDIPNIFGDEEKLKQVFVNLFTNAHDAIDTDGTISIATSVDQATGEVKTCMVDTGRGIAPEKIDRIFDPFFTTKPVGQGTGLGLSVTFGIIKEHGGRIKALSPPPPELSTETGPMGTAFIIHLPPTENSNKEEKENV